MMTAKRWTPVIGAGILALTLPTLASRYWSSPVLAFDTAGRTEAESYVLEQVAAGYPAMLAERFPAKESRMLSGAFIRELLTNPGERISVNPHGITIDSAWIPDGIDLKNENVAYDVTFTACEFQSGLDFTQCHFAKGLSLRGDLFAGTVDLSSVVIDLVFMADDSTYSSDFIGGALKIGGDLFLRNGTFTSAVDITQADIAGNFLADGSTFHDEADFDTVRVKGNGYFRGTVFERLADFSDASFTNLFLTETQFNNPQALTNFSGLRMDTGLLEKASFAGPVNIEGLNFQNLSPTSWEKLQSLAMRSTYNAEFYSNLESLFRKHGYFDQADAVYIAQRERQRRELLSGFAWLVNLLQDWFIGYGRHLERLLLWSTVFIFTGLVVFRREADMKTKKPEDAERYKNKYSAFWYSLDLFLPVMHLGDADIWTPRDERHKALLYKRFHIIIGALFVPIGFAAWTGIIK